MADREENKPVLLVTGASAGLGDAIARKFAAGGYRVVAVARRKERLEALAAELKGAEIAVFAGDVTDPALPEQAVAFAMEKFGRLDCLVNNAGAGKLAPIGQAPDADIDEMIDISLKAPIRFSRAAVKVMQPGSSIIAVGSVWGIIGGMGGGVYCVVKAGLIGLTQSLAIDYGAQGIRANLVAPGVIKTDMTAAYWDAPYFQRINHEMTPFNREGTMEDVANAVYFLASPQGGYINGQTIALDGGWSTTKYLTTEALMAERVPYVKPAS